MTTFSFWGSLAGSVMALHPYSRKPAGWLLLLVGFGGFGANWERLTGCDLRRLRTAKYARPLRGAAQHVPQALVGVWLISNRDKEKN